MQTLLECGFPPDQEEKPHISESRDEVVFCSDIVRTGRGGQTNCKPLQHLDYIDFPSLSKEGISSQAAEF
jgi:hypothetical protein